MDNTHKVWYTMKFVATVILVYLGYLMNLLFSEWLSLWYKIIWAKWRQI